jgi:hypothetical protein
LESEASSDNADPQLTVPPRRRPEPNICQKEQSSNMFNFTYQPNASVAPQIASSPPQYSSNNKSTFQQNPPTQSFPAPPDSLELLPFTLPTSQVSPPQHSQAQCSSLPPSSFAERGMFSAQLPVSQTSSPNSPDQTKSQNSPQNIIFPDLCQSYSPAQRLLSASPKSQSSFQSCSSPSPHHSPLYQALSPNASQSPTILNPNPCQNPNLEHVSSWMPNVPPDSSLLAHNMIWQFVYLRHLQLNQIKQKD